MKIQGYSYRMALESWLKFSWTPIDIEDGWGKISRLPLSEEEIGKSMMYQCAGIPLGGQRVGISLRMLKEIQEFQKNIILKYRA